MAVSLLKRSVASGKMHQMVLEIDAAEFTKMMDNYRRGALVQDAFPNLGAGEREFIINGVTPKEFEELFGPDESTPSNDPNVIKGVFTEVDTVLPDGLIAKTIKV